jgi:hypothetical protein
MALQSHSRHQFLFLFSPLVFNRMVSDHGVPRRRGSANHLVCLEEQCRGNGETEGLRGLDVDDQLELCGLLHRQVGGLGAFQHAIHVEGCALIHLREARSGPTRAAKALTLQRHLYLT